jgi:hypothetical protein
VASSISALDPPLRRVRVPASISLTSCAFFATAVLYAPAAAAGEEEEPAPFTIGSKPAWYVMGGLTSGATVTEHRGGYVGGELSVVRLRNSRFVGFYADGYYDLGIHRTYTTGGFELGYKFVGIDGGAAARFGGDKVDPGLTGRLFFTVGVFSLYARYAYFDAAQNDHVVQVGALLKLPIFSPFGVPDR